MTADVPPPEWVERLQRLVYDTTERFTASTATFQRLLTAVAAPGHRPEELAAELPRWSAEAGPESYRRLVGIGTRFLSRSMRLVSGYTDEYLRGLLPGGVAPSGTTATMPPPPESGDASDWTSWYALYTAWLTDRQAWATRLYQALIQEVASGALRPEDVRSTARDYMQRRLPDLLADMAELNADLVSDVLTLADESLEALSDVLARPGENAGAEDRTIVDVRGPAGSIAQAHLVVENTRDEPASVRCLATPTDAFELAAAPVEFGLEPGETRAVTVRVRLAATAAARPQAAGTVVIRGQGDADLVVEVRATVEPGSAGGQPPADAGRTQ